MIHISYFFFPCVCIYIGCEKWDHKTKWQKGTIYRQRKREKKTFGNNVGDSKKMSRKKVWNVMKLFWDFLHVLIQQSAYHIASSSLSHISLIFPPNFTDSLHLYCLIYLTFHILAKFFLNGGWHTEKKT